nr:hypothetical protein [Candidatus Sigynarchaeota archaeon]
MVEYVIENRFPEESEIDKLNEFLNRIWHEYNYEEGFFDLNKDLFNWYASSPLQKPEYYFICFDKQTREIIGFTMVVARQMFIDGKGPYTMIYGGMMTVDQRYQGLGIGKDLGNTMAHVTDNSDIAGWFAMIEPGSRGLATVRKMEYNNRIELWDHPKMFLRPLNVRKHIKLGNLGVLEKIGAILIEGVKAVKDPRIMPVSIDADIDQLLDLLNSYAKVYRLARCWEKKELLGYLKNPLCRGMVLKEQGRITGVAIAIVTPFFLKGEKFILAMLENCHYRDLSKPDQNLLVRSLLYQLKQEGIVAVTEFGAGYYDLAPLRANRFIGYKRRMVLYFLPVMKPDDERLKKIKENKDPIYVDIR